MDDFASKLTMTVHEILAFPFLSRSREEQALIIRDGKPRPQVTIQSHPEITLDPAIYERVPWVTACDRRKQLFCWPCLLTGDRDLVWTVVASRVPESVFETHVARPGHPAAVQLLKSLETEQPAAGADNRREPASDGRYRELGGRRPAVLRLLVDVVCEVARAAPLGPVSSAGRRLGAEEVRRALRLARALCARGGRLVDEADALVGAHPRLVEDLVEAVKRGLELRVRREMESAPYVSLVLSEHSTDSGRSHLSMVARYVQAGRAREHLLGYMSVLSRPTPRVLHDVLRAMLLRFGIAGKLLSLSLGGGVLTPVQVSALDSLLLPANPNFCLMPCYFQPLCDLLLRSLAGHPEAGEFSRLLLSLDLFFDRSSRHWAALDALLLRRSAEYWRTWPFVTLASRHRAVLLEYLESVAEREESGEGLTARGFCAYLRQFRTVFLLRVVSDVIQQPTLAFLEQVLRNPDPEPAFGRFCNLQHSLCVDRTEFEEAWQAALADAGPALAPGAEQRGWYDALFEELVTRVHEEVQVRCSELGGLEFLCLLQPEHYSGKQLADKPLVACLGMLRRSRFQPVDDADALASELRVLKENPILLMGKDAYAVLEFLSAPGYRKVFPQTASLLEFALSLPYRPPTGTEAVKFARFGDLRVVDLIPPGETSVLAVEADFLRELRREDSLFYKQVIAQLVETR